MSSAVNYVKGCVKKSEKEQERNASDLVTLFNQVFSKSENTQLVFGNDEPIYLPANNDCSFHQVVFAHGFFSSALHEIAHWCVAGKQRRQQIDYGYWYAPDGRTAEQQREFETVEIKPQALEWIFSAACNKKMRISVDNLSGEFTDSTPFKQSVHRQVLSYCETGLGKRAEKFRQQLAAFYQTSQTLNANHFKLEDLG